MRFDPALPTAVFVGPTLDRATAARILPANYYGPVRMGDIYRLTGSGVARIVILDGVFHATASVWHREILDALRAGIEVVGAASMGALRAAELHPYGMVGIGTVFQWYRDGVIDGDDEVALLHGDESVDYRPLTVPLVNVRATLAADATLTAAERDAALAPLKAVSYTKRHAAAAVDVKRADAVAALEHCAATSPRPPAAPDDALPPVPAWAHARTRALLRGCFHSQGRLVAAGDVLDRLDADRERLLFEEAALHRFVLAWARDHDLRAPPPARRLDARANGLTEAEAAALLRDDATVAHALAEAPACLEEWARARGIAPPPGEELRAWLLARGPAHFGFARWSPEAAILDRLRIRGELPALVEETA